MITPEKPNMPSGPRKECIIWKQKLEERQRTGRKEQVKKAGREKMIHSMFCPELGPVGHLPPYFINCQLHNLRVH